jgi:hypothetical protein
MAVMALVVLQFTSWLAYPSWIVKLADLDVTIHSHEFYSYCLALCLVRLSLVRFLFKNLTVQVTLVKVLAHTALVLARPLQSPQHY